MVGCTFHPHILSHSSSNQYYLNISLPEEHTILTKSSILKREQEEKKRNERDVDASVKMVEQIITTQFN